VIDRSRRAGFALVLSILGVVLLGALIIATHVAVGLEHRAAAAGVDRQRAFAMSEYALWSAVAGWDAANAALPPGSATRRVVHAAADSADLTVFRLSDELYWLVADARVGEARRRTGINVRAVTDSSGARYEPLRRSWLEIH
jgi:Tfp pilus assembly protein PilX